MKEFCLNPAIVPLVFIVEIAVIDLLYWARVTTFIINPGRFHWPEPILGSDIMVLYGAPVLAALWMGRALSSMRLCSKFFSYLAALTISAVAFLTALFIALNTWGS